MQVGSSAPGTWPERWPAAGVGPVLCTDVVAERAQALAEELGGEALASNAEVAQRADVVVLCHKPPQLAAVAAEVAPHAKAIVSILAATPLADVKAAYPDRPVYRVLPSTPVEVRQGAVILAADDEQDAELDAALRGLFAELGTLVVLDDALVDVAMGLMSNAPGLLALVVEAQVDAGVRHGLTADQASRLVVQTMAGTAELLRRRGYDTLAVRRAVTSPGGSTARGLDALERGGVRAAFSDALDAILKPMIVVFATARGQIADFVYALVQRLHDPDHRLHPRARCSSRSAGACRTRGGRARSSASCATSASPTCRSSGASSRRSGRSTSARSSPSCAADRRRRSSST